MPVLERTHLVLFLCALLLAGCAAPRGKDPVYPLNECDPALPDPCVAQRIREMREPDSGACLARRAWDQVDCPDTVQ